MHSAAAAGATHGSEEDVPAGQIRWAVEWRVRGGVAPAACCPSSCCALRLHSGARPQLVRRARVVTVEAGCRRPMCTSRGASRASSLRERGVQATFSRRHGAAHAGRYRA